MSKYSDEQKYKALSQLNNGDAPALVAKELDVPMTAVLRWKRELKNEMENGTLNTVLDMDRVVLGEVLDKVAEDVHLTEAVGTLTKSLNHADRLSSDLQLTAIHLTSQIKSFAQSAVNPSDILVLTETLCQLQTAFFNSNTTQVNIQNNNGNTGYEEFLSDAPAAQYRRKAIQ